MELNLDHPTCEMNSKRAESHRGYSNPDRSRRGVAP
jgi:hypothetical protein